MRAVERERAIKEYLLNEELKVIRKEYAYNSLLISKVQAKPNIYDSWFIQVMFENHIFLFELDGKGIQEIQVGDWVSIRTESTGVVKIDKMLPMFQGLQSYSVGVKESGD